MKRLSLVMVLSLGAPSLMSAQAPNADPWRRVPALPTSGFRDLAFEHGISDALTANSDDKTRQKEINIATQVEFDKIDPLEKVRRTQAFMMKDPQKAMKLMQDQSATADGMAADIPAAQEAKQRLNEEFERTQAAWTEDFDKAAAPWRARRKVLAETKTKLSGPIHVWASPEAEAEYNGLIDKENAEYEKRSESYYGPNGTVQTWLAKYRREVIEPMAHVESATDNFILQQMQMLDFEPGRFRTLSGYVAVHNYLEKVRDVYGLRRHKLTKELNQ